MFERGLARVVSVQPQEVRALLWSFAYFFCLLAGYYVLRPVRIPRGISEPTATEAASKPAKG